MSEEHARPRKLVPVAPALLYQLFTAGPPRYIQCVEGLPQNARFIGEHYDHLRDIYYLVFESEEWDPIPFGQELPVLNTRFRLFFVVSLLTKAEALLSAMYGSDVEQWLTEWRGIKGALVEAPNT